MLGEGSFLIITHGSIISNNKDSSVQDHIFLTIFPQIEPFSSLQWSVILQKQKTRTKFLPSVPQFELETMSQSCIVQRRRLKY